MQKVKKQIKDLIEKIEEHNYNYYVLDNPSISDERYDELFNELLKLEKEYPEFQTKNSPTQKVGGKILDGFKKYKHRVKMYSLDKIHNENELKKWFDNIKEVLKEKK